MAVKFEVGKTYRVAGFNWKGVVTITGFGEEHNKFRIKMIKLESESERVKEFFSRPPNQVLWGDGDEWDAKPYTLQLENK